MSASGRDRFRFCTGEHFGSPVHGLQILQLVTPAVNCWATIIRPLCGLINLLFVQTTWENFAKKKPKMETPLTPMDFARRARKLYGEREGVVDGELSLTYAQFFDRIDRWSSALQRLGVRRGDRVAYLAPNTHAQLESFYAVPQIGAVLVPLNYRLTADDFVYLINHSGARVVCAHADYLAAVDSIRSQLPGVEHFVALEGERAGRRDYEEL